MDWDLNFTCFLIKLIIFIVAVALALFAYIKMGHGNIRNLSRTLFIILIMVSLSDLTHDFYYDRKLDLENRILQSEIYVLTPNINQLNTSGIDRLRKQHIALSDVEIIMSVSKYYFMLIPLTLLMISNELKKESKNKFLSQDNMFKWAIRSIYLGVILLVLGLILYLPSYFKSFDL